MATLVLLPQIGVSDESALLAQWHVAKGDKVSAGQLLFTLETDKSTFEIEADTDGVVLDLLCDEGDEVAVANAVFVIGLPGESWTLPKPEDVKLPRVSVKSADLSDKPSIGVSDARAFMQNIARGISPRARMTAERMGIDPGSAVPTGPEGRIIERDVYAAGRTDGSGTVALTESRPKTPCGSAGSTSTGIFRTARSERSSPPICTRPLQILRSLRTNTALMRRLCSSSGNAARKAATSSFSKLQSGTWCFTQRCLPCAGTRR
jgi:pyruvate/2-oxoglutarate dehydrogenase complex dihydrolipoamide acyltransferase (E2) component